MGAAIKEVERQTFAPELLRQAVAKAARHGAAHHGRQAAEGARPGGLETLVRLGRGGVVFVTGSNRPKCGRSIGVTSCFVADVGSVSPTVASITTDQSLSQTTR
jgi:hypothetical protein